MKTLPIKLRKNGFNYTQVLRGKKSCIYEQEVSEGVKYYEVFKIRIKPERYIKGKKVEAREWFPHDEAFGYWAWSCRTYERAYERFRELETYKTLRNAKKIRRSRQMDTRHLV